MITTEIIVLTVKTKPEEMVLNQSDLLPPERISFLFSGL